MTWVLSAPCLAQGLENEITEVAMRLLWWEIERTHVVPMERSTVVAATGSERVRHQQNFSS